MVATKRPAAGGAPPDDALGGQFREQFDEPLERVLDINTWSTGIDIDDLYVRLDREVRDALARDGDDRGAIRRIVFPHIATRADAPPNAGVYRATAAQIKRVHQGLLFNGGVEAVDGTSALHETLPLTVAQIGISLVSYNGDEGTWQHRLYRRDVRNRLHDDPAEAVLALLESRHQRGALGQDDDEADSLNQLVRRGVMTYAERAVLLHKSTARWRMGHGSPAPRELLTGAAESFLDTSLEVLRSLILDHRRFVFVASTPAEPMWLSIGAALQPLEYAICETSEHRLLRFIERRGYRAYASIDSQRKALRFAHEVGPQIVLGLYRASRLAPPQLFFAHVDHAHEAALIALADSVLQDHRGFPLLIDLADTVCSAHFSAGAFAAGVDAMYSAAGAPYRYLHERATRKG
jgi:hypothetical protein